LPPTRAAIDLADEQVTVRRELLRVRHRNGGRDFPARPSH
jgi:hypothetical protein